MKDDAAKNLAAKAAQKAADVIRANPGLNPAQLSQRVRDEINYVIATRICNQIIFVVVAISSRFNRGGPECMQKSDSIFVISLLVAVATAGILSFPIFLSFGRLREILQRLTTGNWSPTLPIAGWKTSLVPCGSCVACRRHLGHGHRMPACGGPHRGLAYGLAFGLVFGPLLRNFPVGTFFVARCAFLVAPPSQRDLLTSICIWFGSNLRWA